MTLPDRPTVAVIIPALNEAGAVGLVIRDIPPGIADYVILADNGSTDGTGDVAAATGAIVVREERRGYGSACRAGLRRAAELSADIVVYLDGDYADDPACMPDVVGPVLRNEADLVIGSRLTGRLDVGAIPPHQRFGNRV